MKTDFEEDVCDQGPDTGAESVSLSSSADILKHDLHKVNVNFTQGLCLDGCRKQKVNLIDVTKVGNDIIQCVAIISLIPHNVYKAL